MEKHIEEIIRKMVFLPVEFDKGGKSEVSILEDSGYFSEHHKISADEIKEVLGTAPDLIAEWLKFSDDSRSSRRWMFSRSTNGLYTVGFWPDNKEYENLMTPDGFYACAVFIKRKAEFTRNLFNK